MEFKALTFNIHHGRGLDGKLNLRRIAEVIQESRADLIGLNEVDRSFSRRSGYVDQVCWLSDKLNLYHAFGAAVTTSPNRTSIGQYGNAFLSRYPIVKHINHTFSSSNRRFVEGRSLLEADVLFQKQLLKVFVTHLSLNPWKRSQQVDMILSKCKQTELPVILMGDWNMQPETKIWRKVTSSFIDVCYFAHQSPCRTFPSLRPKVQLDYIFVSEHFHIDSVQVINHSRKASDHMPIKAELRLTDRM